MRKVLLLSIFLFVTGVVANAQLKFGVKAGANISNVAVEKSENKVGFNTGVFAQYKFAKFAVQPEVLFSMQGAKFDGGKSELNYINIPVMAQYYIIPGLAVEAGPQLGFLISAKDKVDGEDFSDVKDFMNSTDFAINFGASYELPVLPVGVFARYSLGLSDIAKEGSDPGKNRVFQIGAFVKF